MTLTRGPGAQRGKGRPETRDGRVGERLPWAPSTAALPYAPFLPFLHLPPFLLRLPLHLLLFPYLLLLFLLLPSPSPATPRRLAPRMEALDTLPSLRGLLIAPSPRPLRSLRRGGGEWRKAARLHLEFTRAYSVCTCVYFGIYLHIGVCECGYVCL